MWWGSCNQNGTLYSWGDTISTHTHFVWVLIVPILGCWDNWHPLKISIHEYRHHINYNNPCKNRHLLLHKHANSAFWTQQLTFACVSNCNQTINFRSKKKKKKIREGLLIKHIQELVKILHMFIRSKHFVLVGGSWQQSINCWLYLKQLQTWSRN